jgi:hypothetical protein
MCLAKGGKDQHHGQQDHRVHDAGHRAATAGAHVGGGAGDGAGGRKAAKQGRGQVGQALGDEFLVGIVAVLDGGVGDPCRQQGLDGAEEGDGEGWRDQLAEGLQGQLGQRKGRQILGDAVEARADGLHGQLQQGVGGGGENQHAQGAGQPAQGFEALGQPVPRQQHDDGGDRQGHSGEVDGVQVGEEGLHLAEELAGQVVDLQAQEVLDLGKEDDHRDAIGEADYHRLGDEADQVAEAKHAHGDQHGAGQHGGHQQVLHAVFDDDAVDDGNEGAGGAADLHSGAAEGGDQEAGNDGRPDAGGGRHAGGDGEGHGQGQGEDADRQAGGGITTELRAVVAGQRVEKLGVENDLHGASAIEGNSGLRHGARFAEDGSLARYDAGQSIVCRRSGAWWLGAVQEKRLSLAALLPAEALCMTSTSIFTAATKTVAMPPPTHSQACRLLAGKPGSSEARSSMR